jgi:hypothetical protein
MTGPAAGPVDGAPGGLPRETAEAAEALLGARPLRFEPRGGGYTLAITGVLHLLGGGSVFLKAAAPGTPPDDPVVEDLRQERAVLEAVAGTPAAPCVPRLLAGADDPQPLLLLEDLSAASWPLPYPDDLGPLAAALDALAAVGPPAMLEDLVAVSGSDAPSGWWARVAADPGPLASLGIVDPGWLAGALPALVAAEARVDLSGEELVHGDLWYANICFADRGPVVVDWGSAMRGNARLDRATVASDLLVVGRDAGSLAFDGLEAWLALLAGNQAVQVTLPPGPGVDPASTLRADQASDLAATLPGLARLLDLPPLPHTHR